MAFFDHYSANQSTALGSGFVTKSAILLYDSIKKIHVSSSTALEIGPGRGDFCEVWLKSGGEITALEANPDMGQELSSKGVRVIEAFAPPLPFEDVWFDVVVASHVIEHMPTVKEAGELIVEMARVCHHGGVVCIVAPDIRAWQFDFWNADYTHNYVTSPRRMEQLFLNSGLRVEFVTLTSGHFAGMRGTILGFLAMCLPNTSSGKGFFAQKLYKLKLTFLRNFMIIGRKS